MRFPNIIQIVFLVLSLIVVHWLLKKLIILPDQENLKTLLMSSIKLSILLFSILILSKKGIIDKQNITVKKSSMFLYLISSIIALLIVFNPILGSITYFKTEDVLKYADSIISRPTDIFVFLNLVIIVPIFEELFFRSIIFNGLKNNHTVVLALLISSLLFGFFHIDYLGSTVFGLWLGWVYLKTNNILLSIIAHSVCNLVTFLFRIIAQNSPEQHVFIYIGENRVIISVVMFLASGLLFYLFNKKFEFAKRPVTEQS
ncbi:MAG TPA: type II CAAX endopeptidase family protein [Sphingobacterium sp.]|nr:type II CAAX endopeptidase family protein [Sphingobacterium sp.]